MSKNTKRKRVPESPLDAKFIILAHIYPYWINAGKTGALLDCYRGSRPSSNHPGIVAAAFCDGSVRPISDSMDKATFRDAMNPTSGRAFAANAFN
ncbi:MAG: DUF1559 domain-containing protein [Thermoguttaceae bacterium]